MPDNDVARKLLDRTGPLAVSSANLTGRDAATDGDQAMEMLGEKVAVVIDGGETAGAVPSTIIDATGERPRLLRLGAISVERLDAALAEHGVTVETPNDVTDEPAEPAEPAEAGAPRETEAPDETG
jgi:tRNA A37 threonylcarbamoyladenosine synthetase subunit TsaC/SUA5/YrdC